MMNVANKLKTFIKYFSVVEIVLWIVSVILITTSFCVFDRGNYLALVASLIGTTALIFMAKGNPFGHVLMIGFGILYGIISWTYQYYGEMITYLGMSLPMAIISLVSWLKNPYKGKKSQVKINTVTLKHFINISVITVVVTVAFYFILQALGTANLLISTVSVATSFFAVSFSFMRSPFYALAYAVNDVVLIVLWLIATFENITYLSVVICFVAFLANDLYSFINWLKMKKRQAQ